MNFIKILSILTVGTSPQIESNIKMTAQNIMRRYTPNYNNVVKEK